MRSTARPNGVNVSDVKILTGLRSVLGATRHEVKRTILLLGVLSLVMRGSALAAAAVLADGREPSALALGLVASLAYFARRVAAAVARIDVECDLHRASARALLESDVLDVPGADPHVTVFDGVYHGTEWLVSTLPSLAADVVASVAAAIVLATWFPLRLLALAGLSLVLVIATAVLLRRQTYALQRRALDAYQALADAATTIIDARLELVARAAEPTSQARLARASAEYRSVATRAALGSAVLGRVPIAVGLALSLAVLAVDAGRGGHLDWPDTAHLLVVATTLPVLASVLLLVQELGRIAARLIPFAALLSRPVRPEIVRAVEEPAELPAEVTFSGVSFAYTPAQPPVLERCDLAWTSGLLVLRGPNGSGKTTAMRLLLGLRPPTAGRVAVGPLALDQLDVVSLRRRIAYLPQRPYLGHAYETIREALSLFVPDAEDRAMRDALARVSLLEAFSRSGDPLRVAVGELSAGQRQRLALARLVLGGGDLVVMDEPDANLDAEGVRLVVDMVKDLVSQGKMVAVAAHGPELLELEGAATWEFGTRP